MSWWARSSTVSGEAPVVVVDDVELRSPTAPAELVERGVRGDPVGPGPNADRPSKLSRERTMRIIASCAASSASRLRTGDATTHGVDAVVVPSQQLVERGAVTGSGGGDQLVVGGARRDHGVKEISPRRPRNGFFSVQNSSRPSCFSHTSTSDAGS